jgi:hypothetical protein
MSSKRHQTSKPDSAGKGGTLVLARQSSTDRSQPACASSVQQFILGENNSQTQKHVLELRASGNVHDSKAHTITHRLSYKH